MPRPRMMSMEMINPHRTFLLMYNFIANWRAYLDLEWTSRYNLSNIPLQISSSCKINVLIASYFDIYDQPYINLIRFKLIRLLNFQKEKFRFRTHPQVPLCSGN